MKRKVVKGWALTVNGRIFVYDTLDDKSLIRKVMGIYKKKLNYQNVGTYVPCTITYQLPRKARKRG